MTNRTRFMLLLPFSLLYGVIIRLRNWLFDRGIFPSEEKTVATIVVGNLTVGGTGKTPHVEYIVEKLQSEFKVAVLSRGYKRFTKGFNVVTSTSTANEVGDEPKQIATKFTNIPVVVCENRSKGIDQLLKLYPNTELVILDDAFQHRRLKHGFSVLLTDFNRLHTRDSMLPGGNLREPISGSLRASIIMVTKCPPGTKPIELRSVELEVKPHRGQRVLFSGFNYEPLKPLFPNCTDSFSPPEKLDGYTILLVTGIVSPTPILNELEPACKSIVSFNFPDHHSFTQSDLVKIERKFDALETSEKIIIVTEKDAARLIDNKYIPDSVKKYIFVLPVRVQILNDQETIFIQKLKDYVREDTRNR